MKKSRNRLVVVTSLSLLLVTACSMPDFFPLSLGKKSAPSETVEPSQPEELSEQPDPVDVTITETEAWQQLPDELVLGPGASYAIPFPNGQVTSSDETVVTVQDKTLQVSAEADTGDMATVTVTLSQQSKQMTVKVKQALEDTIHDQAAIPTVTNPAARVVVVNKQRALPADYVPADLVYPDVLFYHQDNPEKKMLRAEAAKALEEMFAQAKLENIHLMGVSGYRSYQTQKDLFNYYVKTRGEEHARMYSAYPGTSEHQTGLAIDVAGASGTDLLEESFAYTAEGQWLATNASKFGFIIRYPQGKEEITGYAYEPWHLRYVGKNVAEEIAAKGITLEEYFLDAVPVSAGQ